MVVTRVPSGKRGRAGGSGCGPECRSGPGFRIGAKRRRRCRRKPEPKATLTGGRSIGGKTRSNMQGCNSLGKSELCGSVEGRDCSAAKRRVPDGSDRKRRRVWTSVPACRSWPPSPGMSAARKGAASRSGDRKCDTRRPAAQVSMPPEAVGSAVPLTGNERAERGTRRGPGSDAGPFFVRASASAAATSRQGAARTPSPPEPACRKAVARMISKVLHTRMSG